MTRIRTRTLVTLVTASLLLSGCAAIGRSLAANPDAANQIDQGIGDTAAAASHLTQALPFGAVASALVIGVAGLVRRQLRKTAEKQGGTP